VQLKVHGKALAIVEQLRTLVPQIRRHDRSLADQVRRAASSMVLNIAEGTYSDAGTARARFHSAAASANETRSALKVAAAWGYIDSKRATGVDDGIDEVLRMLWALASPKK
jgi:four helix bundle protein